MADLGLTPGQLANANEIVAIGKRRGMSDKDIQTALAVALAESNLQNYANSNVPESLQIPHDAVGSDHMSVGVFQQQVGIWGGAPELMNLSTAANKFYDALAGIQNRNTLTIPQAAQAVQRSAFSDGSNYEKHVGTAQLIAGGTGVPTSADNYTTGSKTVVDPVKWIMDGGNLARIGLFLVGAVLLTIAAVKLLKDSGVVDAAATIATRGVIK